MDNGRSDERNDPRERVYEIRRRKRSNPLSSCLIATAVLLVISASLVAVFFTLFRPKSPKIIVASIHLPQYTSNNGTLSFTFAQYSSVRNPNRAAFSHYDSTLELIYGGTRVGFMFIPAAEIDAGRTQYMEASFVVGEVKAGGGVVGLESRMKVRGNVRVLRFLTHHVEASVGCRIGLDSTDGPVLGFRC